MDGNPLKDMCRPTVTVPGMPSRSSLHQVPGAADVVEVGGLDRDVLYAFHARHADMDQSVGAWVAAVELRPDTPPSGVVAVQPPNSSGPRTPVHRL
ncbi:hypothetical protein ACFCWG_11720 [Streptomyces sp. NPDC056390]|uniref:hypothetical protein n=1 Tax=Streptomyces sp. NPDC056390 TaxID=3345806 RepID=UPI0035E32AE5